MCSLRKISAVAIAVVAVATVPVFAAQVGSDDRPGEPEIARALSRVKSDPNLATERTVRTLRWVGDDARRPAGASTWVQWLSGLFRRLDQSGRLVVWMLMVVLAVRLGLYVVRLWGRVAAPTHADEAPAPTVPTHVRGLDIRPQALPDDVGATARRLWINGDQRAALSLLYRGLVSRLANQRQVPIRDSSTEGDCLALSAGRLSSAHHGYAVRLVGEWRRAAYGRETPSDETVHGLCDDFSSVFETTPFGDGQRSDR